MVSYIGIIVYHIREQTGSGHAIKYQKIHNCHWTSAAIKKWIHYERRGCCASSVQNPRRVITSNYLVIAKIPLPQYWATSFW